MTRSFHLAPLLALALSIAAFGCDSADLDDDNGGSGGGTPAATVADWAGSYTGQSRFGGTGGTWGNGGTYPLVVTSTGQVTVSGNLIVGATYDATSGAYAWTLADGNPSNGSITFRSTFTSSNFFGDLSNNTAGQSFTGSIQFSGQGALDYRGVLR
ncbi:hypothetical protein [Rubrivirga sp. IMCC45206]|uniref:hypothetical protein n=1 Tax=Rubrivirga sp. IMCC45206 TaxID=3391614 RepID=UPI00398FABDC